MYRHGYCSRKVLSAKSFSSNMKRTYNVEKRKDTASLLCRCQSDQVIVFMTYPHFVDASSALSEIPRAASETVRIRVRIRRLSMQPHQNRPMVASLLHLVHAKPKIRLSLYKYQLPHESPSALHRLTNTACTACHTSSTRIPPAYHLASRNPACPTLPSSGPGCPA